MNLISFDNILKEPNGYLDDITKNGFQELMDGEKIYSHVQPRGDDDEFSKFVLDLFRNYTVKWNVAVESGVSSFEGMSGDIIAVLSLSDNQEYVTALEICDEQGDILNMAFPKFNRMIAFTSDTDETKDAIYGFMKYKTGGVSHIIFLEEDK